MSALINRLTRDHRRFGRIMTLLEGLVARFHGGEEPDYELMCELLEYVVDYADQVHHRSEELIFAAMGEAISKTATGAGSGTDSPPQSGELSATAQPSGIDAVALQQALDSLSAQHQQLEDMNRVFRDAIEGIVHEEVLSRDTVAEQGQAMISLMRTHIADEEARVFPAARELLSTDDWVRLEAQAPSAADPVFGQLDPLRFRTLYDYLKDELDAEDAE
jgi:hemerythrin-like domain-containing protein